jgi:hypothetical protein
VLRLDFLETLIRRFLRRTRSRRDPAPTFRPTLERFESRAAPSAIVAAETLPGPPVPAIVRVSASTQEDSSRSRPVLSVRAFDDRLFGDEYGDALRGQKDRELFTPLRLCPALDPALTDEEVIYCSGKDDSFFLHAPNETRTAVADAVFTSDASD